MAYQLKDDSMQDKAIEDIDDIATIIEESFSENNLTKSDEVMLYSLGRLFRADPNFRQIASDLVGSYIQIMGEFGPRKAFELFDVTFMSIKAATLHIAQTRDPRSAGSKD